MRWGWMPIACFFLSFSSGRALALGRSAHLQSDSCLRPELLFADQITDSTARLTWTDVGDRYEIELVPGGQSFSGNPTLAIDVDPPYAVTQLTPGRNYRFRVRTVCNDSTFSEWSVPRSFTTALNNARPCPLNLALRDTSCSNPQVFPLYVDAAPGTQLGTDVLLHAVRIAVEHPHRADLRISLVAPDGTRVRLVDGLNPGDRNLGQPLTDPTVCWPFVELTDNADLARPWSAAAEKDDVTGYFLPLDSLSSVHNGQNPVGLWQVEICDEGVGSTGRLRLFQLVFSPVGCLSAPVPSAVAANETGAEIAWVPDASGDSLILEYGLAGFVPGDQATAGLGGTVVLLPPGASSWTLSALQPLRHYEAYLRRRCSTGLWSANSVRAAFFTNCPPALLATFEPMPVCPADCAEPCPLSGEWRNISQDDLEWRVFSGPGLTFPTAGPAAAAEGEHYLYFRNACAPSGTAGKTALLRSRCLQVDAPSTQPCHFSLDLYMNTTSGQMGALALQASTDGGQTWKTLAEWSGNRGKRWRREYVDLSECDGQVVAFQLVASSALGAFGDIAVDNIAFYGTKVANVPEYVFYRDADGDGFGDDAVRVVSCYPFSPPGFVSQGGDCDDTAAYIYPGAPEILCNQMDENCNGMADDGAITPPTAPPSPSICAGQAVVLTAPGTPLGTFYWYNQSTGGTPIAAGPSLSLPLLENTRTVFLADSMTGPQAGCSSPRVPATVTVHPNPALQPLQGPTLCLGTSFDLSQIIPTDTANTGGVLTYHAAAPPTAANQLSTTVVKPSFTALYYVKSTTAFGCSDFEPITVTVIPSPEVSILPGDSVAVCRTRTVQLQAVEAGVGKPPIAYSWSNGLTLPSIPVSVGNTPGAVQTYTVTATDANGCTATDSVRVHTLNNVTQTAITLVQNVSTCGGSDGHIELTPLNGTPPYTFKWAGGMLSGVTGTGALTGLTQGSYRVTITDASGGGCSMVMPQIVINAPGLEVALEAVEHPQCPGINTGAIRLQVNGVNPNVVWSNQQTGLHISGLAPGAYSATVTDGNCTQVLSNIEITAPPPIQIELNRLEHVSCAGQSDGEVALFVIGATPPYRYAWSNGDTTAALQGLPPGAYTCSITDANGCSFTSDTYVVNEPPPLALLLDSLRNVRCFGEKNGYLSVRALGGTPPYRFQWEHGATAPTLDNLAAGVYALTVSDANGCSTSWIGVISQPSALQVEAVQLVPPTCVGAQNGSIALSLAGGQAPFSFVWSNGGTTSSIQGLEVGQYMATIADARGCQLVSPPYVLQAPQLLSVEVDSLRHVGCKGGQTGYLSVEIKGAVAPVAIHWNNQPGTAVLENVPAGQYQLLAVDSRSCRITSTYFINEPELALALGVNSVQPVLCAGEPTGRISVRASGGTPPYQYAWSHGATGAVQSALLAGTYSVTVTDAQGCTQKRDSIVVSEPPALIATANITPVPCFGPQTGSIALSVGGGTPPYRYLWENGDTASQRLYLPAGSYSATVLDQNGCAQVLRSLAVVRRADEFSVALLAAQPVSCNRAGDGWAVAEVNNGTPPYQFAWSAPVGVHANVSVTRDTAYGLSGGTYRVTVTDAEGCFAASEAFLIEEAPPLRISIQQIEHVACKGDATGLIAVQSGGGVPPYRFLWSNGSTDNPARDLPAGTYRVTMTDLRGCTQVSIPAVVVEPAQPLSAVVDTILPDRCGLNQGGIAIRAVGGQGPYTYLWSSGHNKPSLQNLAPGSYQVTITDHLGCTWVSPLYEVVRSAPPLEIPSADIVDVACRGDSTGAIAPLVVGGMPPYQYAWSNGATAANLTGLPAGTYTLTVVDAAGCFRSWMFPVVQPASVLVLTWTTDSSAAGWRIEVTPLGGVPPYDIRWDSAAGGHTGPSTPPLPAGTYRVTVSDANNCVRIAAISVGTVHTQQPTSTVEHLSLVPNPSAHQSRLYLTLSKPATAVVWVLSPTGQRIAEYHETLRTDTHQWRLDAAALPPGLYSVVVILEDGTSHALQWLVVKP